MKKTAFIIILLLMLPMPMRSVAYGHNGFIVKINHSRKLRRSLLPNGICEIGDKKGVYYIESYAGIDRLKQLGDIEYVEPNCEVYLFSAPSDEYYAEQTNLHMINAESAWDIGCFGNNVRIGVIDSGVNNHIDLDGNLLGGYNYLDGDTDTSDTNGHGTFVGGLIAAQANGIGIAGMAHKAKIVPLKCFGSGKSTDLKTIVDAIYGAVDDFYCQIVNMSFGVDNDLHSLKEAIDYVVSAGAVVVAAVGNDGNNKLYYPAAYNNVIGVGSVDEDRRVSGFSQRNGSVFVTAPGSHVKSLSGGASYTVKSGTSFSAPLVSGALAVVKCVDETINASVAMGLLAESAEDLGDPGYDTKYGYGLLNVQSIVNKLLEGTEWFVSPINIADDKYSVYIYNNSTNDEYVVSIFANFDGNKLSCISIANINVLSKQCMTIEYICGIVDLANIKHFLWKDTNCMEPLYKIRQLNV